MVRRPLPVNTGGILPTADEVTVGYHLHRLATVATCHASRRRRDDSRRDDGRRDDDRSSYGRNRRESPPHAGRYRRVQRLVLDDVIS